MKRNLPMKKRGKKTLAWDRKRRAITTPRNSPFLILRARLTGPNTFTL